MATVQEIEGIVVNNFGGVNSAVIPTSEGYVLIDTGMPQQWAKLEEKLSLAGCLPDKLRLVILTHGDFDHSGNCAILQKKYNVKIAIHSGDISIVRDGKPAHHTAELFIAKIIQLLIRSAIRKMHFDVFQPDILLEDGQNLNEYGLAAQIIHTPGHTKGSIAVLCENGALFVGDTVSNRFRPGLAPFAQNFATLRESLTKLKDTKARIVYPGHGKPFPFALLPGIK